LDSRNSIDSFPRDSELLAQALHDGSGVFRSGLTKVPRYQGRLCLLRAQIFQVEEHFRGAGYSDQTQDHGNRGRRGVVSQVGSRLLADVGDRTTLTGQLAEALAGLRKPRARPRPSVTRIDLPGYRIDRSRCRRRGPPRRRDRFARLPHPQHVVPHLYRVRPIPGHVDDLQGSPPPLQVIGVTAHAARRRVLRDEIP
jgi:hypothetical protein